MKIQTGRNPFARETVRKRRIVTSCQWCGSSNDSGKVWFYWVERDTNSQVNVIGMFCNIDCLNSYKT